MLYELWDLRSGNIINTYDTEEEALAVVRYLVALNGVEIGRGLSLSFEDEDEKTTVIAKGLDLADRAHGLKDAV